MEYNIAKLTVEYLNVLLILQLFLHMESFFIIAEFHITINIIRYSHKILTRIKIRDVITIGISTNCQAPLEKMISNYFNFTFITKFRLNLFFFFNQCLFINVQITSTLKCCVTWFGIIPSIPNIIHLTYSILSLIWNRISNTRWGE